MSGGIHQRFKLHGERNKRFSVAFSKRPQFNNPKEDHFWRRRITKKKAAKIYKKKDIIDFVYDSSLHLALNLTSF